MTIVGEAELAIRANGATFTSDIPRVVQPGMTRVGSMGEQAAARTGKAFSLMWNATQSTAMGALAPVTQVIDQISSMSDELHTKSLGLRTAAVGAVGMGVGGGLAMLGSAHIAAQQQLQGSIEQTGHAWAEYGDEIEKTVKHGEHFAVSSKDTYDILATLTTASGSTREALNRYQLVLDMAARRHIPATQAAQLLGSAYAGNTRIFKMFGINVSDSRKEVSAATAAVAAHKKATVDLTKAKQNLADIEARTTAARQGHIATAAQLASAEASVASAQAAADNARFSHGSASPQYAAALARVNAAELRLNGLRGQGSAQTSLSVSQEIELRKAHDAVDVAQQKVTASAQAQTAAQKAAAGAATSTGQVMDNLSTKLSGQASDAANTFTGRLKAIGVTLEDDAAAFGAKWGPTVTAVSTGVTALGSAMTIGAAIMNRWGSAGRMTAAMNAELAAAEETQAVASAAATEATVALTAAESTLAEVDAALAVEGGAAAAGITAEGSAAAGSVVANEAAGASLGGLSGALGKANVAVAGFAAGYIGMTEVLKHTPLGHIVAHISDDIAKLIGAFPNTDPYKNLKTTSGQFGSGSLKGYVFGPTGYFDAQGRRHSWKDAPPQLQAERRRWDPSMQHPGPQAPGERRMTGPGGEQPAVSELRALRADIGGLTHAVRSNVRATEDVPHGIASELARHGHRQWSSPELSTL